MKKVGDSLCFGGRQLRYQHRSSVLDCAMHFSVFMPPQLGERSVPVLYWLSGLTCTDENFVNKAGAQRYAAEYGIALVVPDTSPRGDQVAVSSDGAWDLGQGAGFYINATEDPWRQHYRMYDYLIEELPALIRNRFPLDVARQSIFGHSMGGHGAFVIALKNPGRFRSVSAFAPISSPSQCPWGIKAFSYYLGEDTQPWRAWDTVCLLPGAREKLPALVDQGDADPFLREQLRIELLRDAVRSSSYPMTIRMQPGYDHSYFFIASFIGDHIAFHARHLNRDQD